MFKQLIQQECNNWWTSLARQWRCFTRFRQTVNR